MTRIDKHWQKEVEELGKWMRARAERCAVCNQKILGYGALYTGAYTIQRFVECGHCSTRTYLKH